MENEFFERDITRENKTIERMSLVAEVAEMYYNLQLTQNEIAKKIHTSRSNVSRLLSKAKESGIVEVKVRFPSSRCYQIEEALERKYGIEQVFVYNIEADDEVTMMDSLTRYAAKYIDSILQPGMSVGVTRGSISAGVVRWLKLHNPRELGLKLVQVSGAEATSDPEKNSGDLIRELLKIYGGQAYYLNAPLYVENEELKCALEREPYIQETLKQAAGCDLIITGIGYISEEGMMSYSAWKQYLSRKDISDIIKLGGVGHLFYRIYDQNGNLIPHPVNSRVISVTTNAVNRTNVIAVAFGEERVNAVFGALQQHIIKTLFLDRRCAEKLLLKE